MECYLDNSATTKPCEEAVAAAADAMTVHFGNPSSLHKNGLAAQQLLERSRKCIADSLRAQPCEIIFTPGGTAANNTAIFGAVSKHRGGKIVTSAMEHPSVEQCMLALEARGFTVVRLLPDKTGRITAEQIAEAVDEKTVLISLMAVNNEVGSVLPFSELGRIVRAKKSPALVHVDAVQGFLKLPIVPKKCGIDLLSVSAHKVHGAKGAGALYVRKGVHIKPYLLGGGQENGLCSGTQPMPAIASFAAAVRAYGDGAAHLMRVRALRDRLLDRLTKLSGVQINSPADALPYILNISLRGVPAQVGVNALSERGVYVSAGSACSRGHRSAVLTAMGLPPEQVDTALRISLSRETTETEIDACASAVEDVLKTIGKKGT